MAKKLMELTIEEFLRKTGASNHTPGSGSAAAGLGLISAQLLRTVIGLTDKPKHQERYSKWIPELRRIAMEIDNRILPALENLFQRDSDQFDKTIHVRRERDKAKNISEKCLLNENAKKELEPSTLIPIQISKLCIELSKFASYVFNHGFKSARGDAGVAQQSAIAGAGGCLSIVYLNLLTFEHSAWTDSIRREVDLLQAEYMQQSSDAIRYINTIKEEANRRNQYQVDFNVFLESIPDETELSDSIIENIATKLQLLLWKHKNDIWKYDDEINDPLGILQPDKTLQILGYIFDRPKFLERHYVNGEFFDVAGIINKDQKFVQVSQDFILETQNFTTAHELGHAILHKQAVLHRDRPLDGSVPFLDEKEKQANKFAASFLMPRKQVIEKFKKQFLMDKFVINKNNIFLLTNGDVETFNATYKNRRDVSKFLAKPLAELFQVSTVTMAIRLEELDLIDY